LGRGVPHLALLQLGLPVNRNFKPIPTIPLPRPVFVGDGNAKVNNAKILPWERGKTKKAGTKPGLL
jgi:hypothetical protein